MTRDAIPFPDLGWENDSEMGKETITPLIFSSTSCLYIAKGDADDAFMLRFFISVVSTSNIITIKAGDGPRSGLGDYVWRAAGPASTGVFVFGPLETARFKLIKNTSATRKGTIEIDIGGGGDDTSTITGTVEGFKSR